VLVEMDEGPGWGAAGATDEAMAWASGLVADVLGVSGQGASDVEGGG